MDGLRIGIGYDVHAFATGRPLVLGGIEVPHRAGLGGHSDADVLTHALMDAMLGAAREGDIGRHFPDTAPEWAGARSVDLLKKVAALTTAKGLSLVDADCVVALEEPKVAPYRDAMRSAIAQAIGVEVDRIGLKATTTEGLGAIGRGEGIAAWAVVLMRRGEPGGGLER
jgi:2-C-methyl-D-erythritol 2,4-cyclodiphosphate synthase